MGNQDGGGNSPPVYEVGNAPHITRLIAEGISEKEKETKIRYSSWSSPEAFSNHLSKINPKGIWYGQGNVWEHIDQAFVGVSSLQEAFDMSRNGWKEGGEIVERTRGYINALHPFMKKPVTYAIAGSTPNVPRAVAGNILNMRAPDMAKSSRRKTITIFYNVCESWVVNKDAITYKAAVMAALIDVIEAQGFSCEVICVSKSKGGNRMADFLSVVVKESHQPVDINRLAFSLGHSAMYRGLCFADWMSDPLCKDLGRGLGYCSTTLPTKDQNSRNIYTIQSNRGTGENFKDIETSSKKGLETLIKELQEQGCPAFPKKEHKDVLDKDEEDPPEEDDYYELDPEF